MHVDMILAPVSEQNSMSTQQTIKGRFAPSPSGRMHLGNVFTALISWMSVRSRGGKWLLRIEDLDPQRSKMEYARMIEDDLSWLGLDWDEGGLDDLGPAGPYSQSRRGHIYEKALARLEATGMTYPCYCTRADIMATQAPHESDGRIVYHGICRPAPVPPFDNKPSGNYRATRLYVPSECITFDDRTYGRQSVNLAEHCGDFVLRRADGAWAYQLAVVLDDALMGVTEVVRGCDLLLSSAQQIYLYNLLGYDPPQFAHLPLICNLDGQRLSKRDQSMSMAELRKHHSAEEIVGLIGYLANILPEPAPISATQLAAAFDWDKVPAVKSLAYDI